jgi:hypothetical protein
VVVVVVSEPSSKVMPNIYEDDEDDEDVRLLDGTVLGADTKAVETPIT